MRGPAIRGAAKTLLASLIAVHIALGAALGYTAFTHDPGNLGFTLLVALPVAATSLWLSAPHLMTALVLCTAAAIHLSARLRSQIRRRRAQPG